MCLSSLSFVPPTFTCFSVIGTLEEQENKQRGLLFIEKHKQHFLFYNSSISVFSFLDRTDFRQLFCQCSENPFVAPLKSQLWPISLVDRSVRHYALNSIHTSMSDVLWYAKTDWKVLIPSSSRLHVISPPWLLSRVSESQLG